MDDPQATRNHTMVITELTVQVFLYKLNQYRYRIRGAKCFMLKLHFLVKQSPPPLTVI